VGDAGAAVGVGGVIRIVRRPDGECTPGYYNNEGGGGGEGIRSHLGEPYAPGFYAFGDLLAQWRDEGSLDGLELRR
jgi:cyclohexanone monooxygenase